MTCPGCVCKSSMGYRGTKRCRTTHAPLSQPGESLAMALLGSLIIIVNCLCLFTSECLQKWGCWAVFAVRWWGCGNIWRQRVLVGCAKQSRWYWYSHINIWSWSSWGSLPIKMGLWLYIPHTERSLEGKHHLLGLPQKCAT